MSSNTHIDKSQEYYFARPWLGLGLLTSTGERWKIRRKLLTPAFHFRILSDFVPIISEQSKILIEKISSFRGEYFDIRNIMAACTLDIICGKVTYYL
jgi:docosahexaenoic acid omega-hydroxylase